MGFFKFLLFLCFSTAVYCSITPTCPVGTIPSPHDSQWCYQFVNNSATFSAADHSCFSAGGRLVEVDDQFTNTFIASKAYEKFPQAPNFWIGGKLRKVQNMYLWTWSRSDKFMSYFDWSDPNVGNNNFGDCVSVSSDDSTWNSQNCSETKPFVCQIPATYSIPQLDTEWTYFAVTDKWYKVFTQQDIIQDAAEKNCVSIGGHLASIHSDKENSLIGQLTSTLYIGQMEYVGVWIGLQYDVNGKLSWTDGSAVDYRNWGSQDPVYTDSACVMFCADGADDDGYDGYIMKWAVDYCTTALNKYVCVKSSNYSTATCPVSAKFVE